MNIKKNIAVSDAGMIFNPETGETFTVNPIGAEIISAVKEGHSPESITKTITEKYNVEPTTFEKDYEDFIGLLRNFSLLEEDDQ